MLFKCIRKEDDILKYIYFMSVCDTGNEQIHFVIQKEILNFTNGSQVAVRFPRPWTNIWTAENLHIDCSLALSDNPIVRTHQHLHMK